MIEKFEKWNMSENLGNGQEEFTEKLQMYSSKNSNLDITNFKKEWGDLEDANGTLKYKISLDVNKSGIEDAHFSLKDIQLDLIIRKFSSDDDDDGAEHTMSIEIDEMMIDFDNVSYEVEGFPLYLKNIELDFSDVDDINSKDDLKNITYEASFGSKKND